MIPLWAILAGAGGLFSNAGNFLFRFILREKEDPVAFALYSELLRLLLFGIVAFFDWHFVVTAKSITLVVLIGIVETAVIYYIVRMHSLSHISISTLLSRTRLIWVPILAFIFVHEQLQGLDYLGIVVLFIGITIAVAPRHLMRDQGMKFALVSAFLASVEIVLTKMLLPYASVGVINAAAFLPAIVIMPLLMKSAGQRLVDQFKTNFSFKTIAILMFFAANYISTYALKIGDASKVTAVYYGMMIFAVLAGIIFLKERENIPRKIIGTLVVLGGVLLLS